MLCTQAPPRVLWSEPFTQKLFTAERLCRIIETLRAEDNGHFMRWDGSDLPWQHVQSRKYSAYIFTQLLSAFNLKLWLSRRSTTPSATISSTVMPLMVL